MWSFWGDECMVSPQPRDLGPCHLHNSTCQSKIWSWFVSASPSRGLWRALAWPLNWAISTVIAGVGLEKCLTGLELLWTNVTFHIIPRRGPLNWYGTKLCFPTFKNSCIWSASARSDLIEFPAWFCWATLDCSRRRRFLAAGCGRNRVHPTRSWARTD